MLMCASWKNQKYMNNRTYTPIIYAIILIIGIWLGNFYIIKPPVDYQNIDQNKINSILKLIEENYVDGFNIVDYEDQILESIMRELDPHSNYIPRKEQTLLEDDMKGSFSGIGIEFNIVNDTLVVVSSISGGPSERLGILSGDRIVQVDGENIASIGISNSDIIERLRGEKDSEVEVKIFRSGEKSLLTYNIIRGEIPLYSVDAYFMIENDIGYVKVNRFSATTNEEFGNAANKLLNNGMTKLILDLRGNPGGYLGSAIYMCNQFLESGNLILYTEGKYRSRDEIFSNQEGRLKHIEVVVLINEGSASASEIVSGCMQDLDRAIIVGRRSFGKGLVQEEIRLDDGSAIRLTTQRYYIPSGRSIQKPYNKYDAEYELEMYNKRNQEEVDIPDSLKYKTNNGRTVYGGGGIFPDSIISIDTTLDYTKFNQIRRKNWITEFVLSYQNKSHNIKDVSDIIEDEIYSKFKLFVLKKRNDFDFSMGEEEENYLKTYIKATIAKNIWDNNTYFQVLATEDDFIQKAKEILE